MELANPRAAINSGSSTSDADNHRSSGCESDFGFAFDDSNFSDRISRVEIVPDLPESKSDGEGCSTIADWARNRKRREEIKKENENALLKLFKEMAGQLSKEEEKREMDEKRRQELREKAVARHRAAMESRKESRKRPMPTVRKGQKSGATPVAEVTTTTTKVLPSGSGKAPTPRPGKKDSRKATGAEEPIAKKQKTILALKARPEEAGFKHFEAVTRAKLFRGKAIIHEADRFPSLTGASST